MKPRTQLILTTLLLVTVAVSATALLRPAHASTAQPTLLINLTSGTEDPHAATMALQLAQHGLDAGRRVTVFLNVRAPKLAHTELPTEWAFHGNPPLRDMLSKLISQGAEVLVCPACAKVMGIKSSDLVSGARMATRESLFANLNPDTNVFSY